MEVRHGKADLLVGLKTTRRRVHLRALDINVFVGMLIQRD